MRIPAELVPPIPPVANVSKEPDDVRKVEPVTSVTSLRSAVSAPPQEQSPPLGKHSSPRLPGTPANAQPENQAVAVERRQQERRSEKRPILLDTRSKKGRRQVAGDAKINIKV